MESTNSGLTGHPSLEELQAIAAFSDLPVDGLAWLASKMETFEMHPGGILVRVGEPAEHLTVLFQGEIRAQRPDGRVYVMHAGQVTGLLPYSRLTHYPSDAYAVVECRGCRLHKSHFDEMLHRMPELNQRLVSLLADRIRETTIVDQQREKLIALGKISAGLAHELNNPAAAVRRAAANLGIQLHLGRDAALELEKQGLPLSARLFITQLDRDWIKHAGEQSALDTLERSEREEDIAAWLEQHGVTKAWDVAAALVDAGCEHRTLEEIAKAIPSEFLNEAFTRLTASFTISRLLQQIESSAAKISELVRAVKEYSYMDQMPEQEIDLHAGLESTLIMLRYRLKHGVEVIREYDRTLPPITARGSELNQVWTNLITNSIDAMKESGVLRIRTARAGNCAVVDIIDNGPGIPAQLQQRVFEPFFTTKPVGEGTGLGLDAVYRIVTRHHGSVNFESRPGETRFSVQIPFSQSRVSDD